jgi:quercetin dioxygenase-like cupin family protein
MTPRHDITYGNATIVVYHANKGEIVPKHVHEYSHLTICHAGRCVVRKEKGEKIIDKNSVPLNLLGNEWHEIEALEDDTVFVNIFYLTS